MTFCGAQQHTPLWSLELYALGQRSPTFLAPGTGFVEDNFFACGGGDGGMVQAVTRAMGAADEALLARPALTSCSAARFLTVPSLGVGDPGHSRV